MLSIYLDKLKRRVNARPTRSGPVRQDIFFSVLRWPECWFRSGAMRQGSASELRRKERSFCRR